MNYSILEAIRKDGWYIAGIPEDRRTLELCRIAVQSAHPKLSDTESILHYVPLALRSAELCQSAVSKDGCALFDVPEKILTRELCLTAVKNYWKALAAIPSALRDAEICSAAVRENGQALQFVPRNLMTPTMLWEAIKTAPSALQFVPMEFRTADICLYAGRRDHSGAAARSIPVEVLNRLL